MARRIASLDDAVFADGSLLVLPLGAHEHHGPHLPFETDTIIADAVADRLVAALGTEPVTVLPAEPVGYSREHMDFGGTRTLRYDEAVERWCAIGERAARRGLRRMMLLNAHGGNAPLMSVVAQELRVRANLLCVTTSWTRHGNPASVVGSDEKAFGIHGGDIETSLMLAVAPERVDMAAARRHDSLQRRLAERHELLRAYGPHAFGWTMRDLSPTGVAGDASAATREKGERLLAEAVEGLMTLVRETLDFDLADLAV